MASRPSVDDYFETHLRPLETALTEAINTAVVERSHDPLVSVILNLAAVRELKMPGPPAEKLHLLTLMDPGQDLDDEMFLVLLRALSDRKLVQCVGVVTTMEPSVARAQLARGTLDVLGMREVPVGAGSGGNAKGTTTAMEGLEYVGGLGGYAPKVTRNASSPSHAFNDGIELMVRALAAAAPRSITLVIIASLKDAASLLRSHEALFVAKVREVVIQGGVQDFKPGVAAPGTMLEPDTAHNNEFDAEASKFFYERCQTLGVPLLIVSRFAAAGCQVPRAIYDEMAATGNPIGIHLQQTQATSIGRLWHQACAPLDSAERGGLPGRCDKQWFCSTFCRGEGTELGGTDEIWPLVQTFNMYDPLALICALPSLASCFDFAELKVGEATHRVVGTSKTHSGVRPDSGVSDYMHRAFMDGLEGERKEKQRVSDEASLAAATIAALRAENEALRAKLPQ